MFWKIWLLVIFTFFLFFNCQQKADVETMDIAAEEAILKDLIKKQDDAWVDRNFEDVESLWAHEPYSLQLGVNFIIGNYVMRVGWDSISARYKRNFSNRSEYAEGERPRKTISNHFIKLYDNVAWMVCDIQSERKFEGIDRHSSQKNVRIYEKKNGQWKIVFGYNGIGWQKEPQLTDEMYLGILGYRLFNSNQNEKAIEVLKLNVKLFPESSNAHENLANAYLRQGNKEMAKEHCEKALELNPLNRSAKEMMEKI
jgi:tetratricopeptide (TPR) repeat protein